MLPPVTTDRQPLIPTSLEDAPPPVKLTWVLLPKDGAVLPDHVEREGRLAPRTVRRALADLERRGLVTRSTDPRDARKNVYALRRSDRE